MHDEINIFGILKLPTFGLMIAIGVLFLIFLLFYYLRKYKVPESKIDTIFIIGAISGMMFALGAYFFDALWHGIAIAKEEGTPFHFDFGGITFSGGLFTGILCFFVLYLIIMKHERQNVFFYFDIFAIGICVAHAFGRFGCFFGGCCYGKVVESGTFLSILYPTENGWQTVYPTQLFESAFLFLLLAVLVFVAKKNRTAVYLIGYNVFRFLLEYLRGDDRGASPFGALSPSQFMSIIMFIWGLIALCFRKKIEKWLLTKNKPIDDYPENNVERMGNGIVYKNNFLNYLNTNFKGKLIFSLMVFAITTISFGIIANGVTEKKSIQQVSKKITDQTEFHFEYNNKVYLAKPTIEKIDNEQVLLITSTFDDITISFIPDWNRVNLIIKKTGDEKLSLVYKTTYIYRYHLFKNEENPEDGRTSKPSLISPIDYNNSYSYELEAYSSLVNNFASQCAKQMGDLTSSIVPLLYIILIVLEFIFIILYILFYFFGTKFFSHTKPLEVEFKKEDEVLDAKIE